MHILIANDDGIRAPGLAKLAACAKAFGKVTVVAPEGQCSAMSHRITIGAALRVQPVPDFPVQGVTAYSVGGTPADCVKVAVEHLLPQKPDHVLSGINSGFNAGMDIAYSGTVAAAMEGLMKGIPAAAVSMPASEDFALVDAQLPALLEELLHTSPGAGRIWNVNFPAASPERCRGILRGCALAKEELFPDVYSVETHPDGGKTLVLSGSMGETFAPDTDLHALANGYITVSAVTSMVMGQ